MNNVWSIVASMAVVLTAVQLGPQLYQSLKTKKVRDLSLGFTLIVMAGSLIWLIYGVHIADWAVIIANSLNFLGSLVLFCLKINYSLAKDKQ